MLGELRSGNGFCNRTLEGGGGGHVSDFNGLSGLFGC